MTIVDANVLLYAYNADAPQHIAAARWLKNLFDSGDAVALPWVTVWAFIRICTNARIWDRPLAPQQAFAIVNDWLAFPSVVMLDPGPRHWELLQTVVANGRATGSLVSDAVLAALAMENGASLASTDQDFGRFKGLQWINPLDQ